MAGSRWTAESWAVGLRTHRAAGVRTSRGYRGAGSSVAAPPWWAAGSSPASWPGTAAATHRPCNAAAPPRLRVLNATEAATVGAMADRISARQ